MEHALQVQLAHELLEHIDAGTTCLADRVATNPTANYTDPHRFDREMKILFRRYPLMMGLSCRIPEPGDYFTDDVCGVPILIVRDNDGDVRAFLNVCRHRGSLEGNWLEFPTTGTSTASTAAPTALSRFPRRSVSAVCGFNLKPVRASISKRSSTGSVLSSRITSSATITITRRAFCTAE